jgi:hypothetical protein
MLALHTYITYPNLTSPTLIHVGCQEGSDEVDIFSNFVYIGTYILTVGNLDVDVGTSMHLCMI